MIGGGEGSFIGAVHRMAANLDGVIELVCGCFSSDPDNSRRTGAALYLSSERIYDSYEELIRAEAALPEGERMDFLSIVTPNHLHYAPARMALEHGFHVVVDKPMTFDLKEALALEKVVEQTGNLLCLTHTYSGYPMVKQGRALIQNNILGTIRKVVVQYPQGWLSRLSEAEGNKQASWRTDPARSGKSGAMGDIGTHAAHLAEYMSGLKITELCADLSTFVNGRLLDDDGNVLLRFDNGAKGALIASQIAAGEENALQIAIYGERGGLTWKQEEPNSLMVKLSDQPQQIYRTGNVYHAEGLSEVERMDSHAIYNTRLPSGHPEGMLEAFANIYKNFAATLSARLQSLDPTPEMLDFPTVTDGVRGMRFIDRVVESSGSDLKWAKF